MTRTIENIEKDLKVIETLSNSLAEEMYQLYQRYLSLFAPLMGRQFILTSYYICTQISPDKFMNLSLYQKQELQTNLKNMAKNAESELISLLKLPHNSDENKNKSLTPELLEKWRADLEKNMIKILQNLSLQTNRMWQRCGIITNEIPEFVLEAAAKTNGANEVTSGQPNLLHLLIEARHDQDEQDDEQDNEQEDHEEQEEQEEHRNSTITPIVALYLRLSEIEFTDQNVLNLRSQLRALSAKLSNLCRDYSKKQKEKTIAEAEGSWRSIWYNE